MRVAVISQQGDPVASNVRVLEGWTDPVPSEGQVMVRTEAAALNHLDLWVGRGVPGASLEYPRISGSDGCGRVEAVGAGVDDAWKGRRVLLNAAVPAAAPLTPGAMATPPALEVIGEHTHGTMAEYFVAPVGNVIDIGDADPVEAAAFALAHLTAWRMLVTRGGLQAGSLVLITGIGGGVALAALNIARHFGAKVIVTSRHQAKLERAIELGADEGVLDTGDDWSRAVRSWSGRRGVDLCVDSIGKAVHLSAIKSLARGGTYVTCGCTTGADATTDLARVFWNQLTIAGSTMGDAAEFHAVTSLFLAGHLRPVIDSVVEAADAPRAYARIESGEQFGKVVVRWV